ncbi:MAG: 50S ribosomal protein L23 [Waddliaceae bacterium]|nr:50S ribosomal protein L23 [Waddliaceae bacterium]
MSKKSPYSVIKSRYITEKSEVLGALQESESNKYTKRCNSPKYTFLVDPMANKREIAAAVEEIYKEQKVKVVKVNTINAKPKSSRRFRGRPGFKSGFKKALVTLEENDSIESLL